MHLYSIHYFDAETGEPTRPSLENRVISAAFRAPPREVCLAEPLNPARNVMWINDRGSRVPPPEWSLKWAEAAE
jgi:hypothetical protein